MFLNLYIYNILKNETIYHIFIYIYIYVPRVTGPDVAFH